jgi:hypothetical protein
MESQKEQIYKMIEQTLSPRNPFGYSYPTILRYYPHGYPRKT